MRSLRAPPRLPCRLIFSVTTGKSDSSFSVLQTRSYLSTSPYSYYNDDVPEVTPHGVNLFRHKERTAWYRGHHLKVLALVEQHQHLSTEGSRHDSHVRSIIMGCQIIYRATPKIMLQSTEWKSHPGVVMVDSNGTNKEGVNEREVNMGKTIDILLKHIPCLLHSQLPAEILSPSISLHLFPTTHPHLPTVRGRVAYIAALWSAPVAWGRLPGLKVRLEILNQRFNRVDEKLTIRWRAHPMSSTEGPLFTFWPETKAKKNDAQEYDTDFSGLFTFEFDEAGLISKHTIENIERDDYHEKQSRVIAITEWLLKKAKGAPVEPQQTLPGLAFGHVNPFHFSSALLQSKLRV